MVCEEKMQDELWEQEHDPRPFLDEIVVDAVKRSEATESDTDAPVEHNDLTLEKEK